MAVADDLNAPLGQDRRQKRSKLPRLLPWTMAGTLGACLVVFVGWAAVVEDPLGGEPIVRVAAAPRAPAAKPPSAAAPDAAKTEAEPKGETKSESTPAPAAEAKHATAEPAKTPPPGMQSITIIDGGTGSRKEVLVPAPGGEGGAGGDTKLLESTRHGQIPRMSADGARPLVAYARPVAENSANPKMPRIAIVVTGLGISSSTTAEALKLPAAVSFAFAPYGTDLDRIASRARGEGHELLLQLPMEPFDYPDNDPGPQTLLTSLAPEQNIDRMHWLMSRFQGYVGVANYMGARFTANDAVLAPMLREVAKRGLMYLDDGSSPRSLAGQIAGGNGLPFAKASVVLDAVPTPIEIDRALVRLEAMARDGGLAVGVSSALPVSIARLAAWAKSAGSRGFLLVPISAAVVKPKTDAAGAASKTSQN
jgi:polysaccharide deacetylase 2 family uncharacterized protein YibQ